MKKNDLAQIQVTDQGFQCVGPWNILHLEHLTQTLKKQPIPEADNLIIDGSQLEQFDSSGALVLTYFLKKLKQSNKHIRFEHFTDEQNKLIDLIHKQEPNLTPPVVKKDKVNFFEFLGREAVSRFKQADDFIILVGDMTTQLFLAFSQFKRFQFPGIVSVIYTAGITALPILGLLSFLIGVVLAYQMGLQLKTYGANIFIAYLSGMAIFREFGPLITAIIVAGRTSSSFTAQIGSMVINEEVDAIRAMGLSPVDLLVIPKVLGLLLVFPLLIFWSDVFSILGSMFMSQAVLGVGYEDFLNRLQESVGRKQFNLGLYKAPAFSILIALVGCFQGFRVQSRTDSVGLQTTKSVVQALFLIIVADAIYSVIYSWLDL